MLEVDLPRLENVTRASRSKRLPVVLSTTEVRSVLAHFDGTCWLMANLLYGSGLRLMEAHRLRIKDLLLDRGEVIVRDASIPLNHRLFRDSPAVAILCWLPWRFFI